MIENSGGMSGGRRGAGRLITGAREARLEPGRGGWGARYLGAESRAPAELPPAARPARSAGQWWLVAPRRAPRTEWVPHRASEREAMVQSGLAR